MIRTKGKPDDEQIMLSQGVYYTYCCCHQVPTRNNGRKQGFVVGKAAVRSHEGGKSHYSDSHKSDSQ